MYAVKNKRFLLDRLILIIFSFTTSCIMLMSLLWFFSGVFIKVVAAPTEELHVCLSGPPTCDFNSVQAAVDSANPGTLIKIASGSYTGVNSYGGFSQVLYVNKTVSLRGGYTITNWDHSDPIANPTILNAQGLGRVVYITGDISPTLQGLHITGGDATGLGVFLDFETDVGGGIYVSDASLAIKDCVIANNIASTELDGRGGGLFLIHSDSVVQDSTFVSNTASTAFSGWGGGVYLYEGSTEFSGNSFIGNIASTLWNGYGGGLSLFLSNAVIQESKFTENIASLNFEGRGGGLLLNQSDFIGQDNLFSRNTASKEYYGWGGALGMFNSTAVLENNYVHRNEASSFDDGRGGGILIRDSIATLHGNTIISNTATISSTSGGWGGGVWVALSSAFTLTNNVIAGNHANTEGNGLWVNGYPESPTSGLLLHNTIANNSIPVLSSGSGQGVYVGQYTTLSFTDTILVGNPIVGIYVDTGAVANLEASLWYENNLLTDGSGSIITGTVNVYGDPAFVDPENWDFHLSPGSASIDSGVAAGVYQDIDGEGRPNGDGYDIGADEYNQAPIPDAGPDQIVDTQVQVTLDGSHSMDLDNGYPLSYRWIQTSGIIVNFIPTISITTFTAPSDPGEITLSLMVTDSLGRASLSTDSVVITINNQSPIADAGRDQHVSIDALVTLDGRDSKDPDDDYPLTYKWMQISGPEVVLLNASSISPNFIAPDYLTVLTFSLIVTDSLGLPGFTPDVVTINVDQSRIYLPLLLK